MSQAMAMKQFLDRNGHELSGLYLGTGPFSKIPRYFIDFGGDLLKTFSSPGFIRSADHKGINVWKSFMYNLVRAGKFLRAIRSLSKEISDIGPDAIINFYDLPGSFVLRHLPGHVMKIAVSHHFYLEHDDFHLPGGKPLHQFLLKRLNAIMRRGCDRIGALSFREGKDIGNLQVIPPLIRDEIREIPRIPGKRDLIYLLHHGFIEDITAIAEKNKDYEADIFLDQLPVGKIPENLQVHLPDANLFMEKMGRCRKLVATSGFDTIAEAACLSIPVVAVPVRNHYEQQCNAIDMQKAGFGTRAEDFAPETIIQEPPFENRSYLEWLKQSEMLHLRLIEK